MDSDFDSAGSYIIRTQNLRQLADRLQDEGYEVFIENQNSFMVTSSLSGSVTAGKPDLIAVDREGQATKCDVKIGRRRHSHELGVKRYMYLLPMTKRSRWYGTSFNGCVVYRECRETPIPASTTDDQFFRALMCLRTIVAEEPPAVYPASKSAGSAISRPPTVP